MAKELNKIGFLVHPRDYSDFFVKYPYAKVLPHQALNYITKKMPPVTVSKITGLKDNESKEIGGYVLSLPITAKTMLEHRSLTRKKIKQAVKKAGSMGIGIMALGGLNASLSKGGKTVSDQNKVGITTGRSYTVKNVTDYILRITNDFNLPRNDLKIAVVGAAGSIGSGCAFRLEKKGFDNFILIDLDRKLDKIKNKMKEFSPSTNIHVDHQIPKIKDAHIVIAATSAPEAVITARDIRMGTFVINDAQPSDISDEVYHEEKITVIEGGVVKTPGISPNVDMGMHSDDENFCCLVEAMVLAKNNHFDNFSVGRLKQNQVDKIINYDTETEFTTANPQNKFGYIKETKLASTAKKLHERIN